MRKKYVLKNKRRFYFFVTFIMMTIFLFISINYTYGFKENKYTTIVVKSGDTLWDIAKEYGYRGDIREHIYDMIKLNNLKSSKIYAGMELKVFLR